MAFFERRSDVQHIGGILDRGNNFLFREFGKGVDDRVDAVSGGNIPEYIRDTYSSTGNTRGPESNVILHHNALAHLGII